MSSGRSSLVAFVLTGSAIFLIGSLLTHTSPLRLTQECSSKDSLPITAPREHETPQDKHQLVEPTAPKKVENTIISQEKAKAALLLKYEELEFYKLRRKYPPSIPCTGREKTEYRCVDTNCSTQLSKDPLVRLSTLLSATDHARRTLVNPVIDLIKDLPPTHLAFVTGASDNHFLESQAMLKDLHQNVVPRVQNFNIYFYDLGLTESQVEQLKRHCRCTVLKFPFELLPESIRRIRCYTWKPLVVQAHLLKANTVVWLDASIRLYHNDSHLLFENMTQIGFRIALGPASHPVAQHSAKDMLSFFRIPACSISRFGEGEANFMAFHNEPLITDVLVASWASCALRTDCMCPEDSRKGSPCSNEQKYSKCHRYDQSAINLVLLSLFEEDYFSFSFYRPLYDIKRGDKAAYFDEIENGTLSKSQAALPTSIIRQ